MNVPCDSFPFNARWIQAINERLTCEDANEVLDTFFIWAFEGIEPEYELLSDSQYYAILYLMSELESL